MSNIRLILRDDYKNKRGESLVNVVTHIRGKKVRIPTGIAVQPDAWDDRRQVIRGASKMVKDNNLILHDCVAKINDILVKYRLNHRAITPESLKYEYAHYSASIDFLEFMQHEIKTRRQEADIESSSLDHHESVMNKLKEFQEKIIFSEIDESFIQRFRGWLKKNKNNGAGTISSNLTVFKTYLSRAVKKKLINTHPFAGVPIPRSRAEKSFLDDDEIKKMVALYKKNILPAGSQKALRHFLFSITTGLRISDVKAIQMEHIVKNILVFLPKKTKNRKHQVIRVPLSSLAKELIKDESPHRIHGPVFTMLSEYGTNRCIKDIAKMLEINKHISFHTARHTFATYFLRKTKNLMALKELLGHSDLREVMVYAHILMEDIEAEMKCFESLI